MESSTKEIDVVFDLVNEGFILREDIRDRRKSVYPIPGFRDEQMVLTLLQAVDDSTIDEYQHEYDLSENQIKHFLYGLDHLGLIVEVEEEYETTNLGSTILENDNNERIASILVDNVKFIKEALEIIRDEPGISRSDAVPPFQEIYGGSETTAYQQFGRRCKWLRALGIIEKRDGGYFFNKTGEQILTDIRKTEEEIQTRYVPLDKILVDQSELDFEYLSQFPDGKQEKINDLRKIFGNYEFSIILVNKTD